MKRLAIFVLFPFVLVFFLTSCSSIFRNGGKNGHGRVKSNAEELLFGKQAKETLPDFLTRFAPYSINYVLNRHKDVALAVVGLLVMLLFTRLYYIQRQRQRRSTQLGREDIALLQMIRESADHILQNLKRKRKVVRLFK